MTSSSPTEAGASTGPWRLAHENPFSWKRLPYVRDLFIHLVSLELRLLHKRSKLGMVWTLVNLIVQLLIFTLILGRVLTVDVRFYPVFLCLGLLCWNSFSESLTMAADSIVNARNVLYQPGFRPFMMPLVVVTTGLIQFVLSCSILAVLLAYYRVPLGWPVVSLPVLLGIQGLLTLALALPLAALSVSFHDTKYLLSVALRFLFFLTPILYATDAFPRAFHPFYAANPLTHLIRAYRDIFMDRAWPDWLALSGVAGASVIALVFGYRFFESRRFRFIEDIE